MNYCLIYLALFGFFALDTQALCTHPTDSTCRQRCMSFQENEILIETLCSFGSSGQVEYIAYTAKKGYMSPHTFHLFKESDLENEMKKGEALYTGMAVAQLFLKPLHKELEGVRRIFFTPAGKLHQFAIEYCNAGDGKTLAEKYEFYRLSSSEVLTHRQSKHRPY